MDLHISEQLHFKWVSLTLSTFKTQYIVPIAPTNSYFNIWSPNRPPPKYFRIWLCLEVYSLKKMKLKWGCEPESKSSLTSVFIRSRNLSTHTWKTTRDTCTWRKFHVKVQQEDIIWKTKREAQKESHLPTLDPGLLALRTVWK